MMDWSLTRRYKRSRTYFIAAEILGTLERREPLLPLRIICRLAVWSEPKGDDNMLCHIMVSMFDLRSNLFRGGELVAPIIFVICQYTL
jgi:hypothetical protein